jgi:hypothetical protein
MAWEPQEIKTPTSIGSVLIVLMSENGTKVLRYNVTVNDQNGERAANVTGELEEIVTEGRINQAFGILEDVRQKAEKELLS